MKITYHTSPQAKPAFSMPFLANRKKDGALMLSGKAFSIIIDGPAAGEVVNPFSTPAIPLEGPVTLENS